MKINSKQLNEMLKSSILKNINEDIQNLNSQNQQGDGSAQQQNNNGAQRKIDPKILAVLKKIIWYYKTPSYAINNIGTEDEMTDTGVTRRMEVERFCNAWGKSNYLVSFDLKSLNNEELERFVRAFIKVFGKKMKAFEARLKRYDAVLAKWNKNKDKALFSVGSESYPTDQVKSVVEVDVNGKKYIRYQVDENGNPIMDLSKAPKIYKIFVQPYALSRPNLKKTAIEHLMELEEILDVEDNTDILYRNLKELPRFETRGKHPFTGEEISTINPDGYVRWFNKDTGEELKPSNYDAIKQFVQDSKRKGKKNDTQVDNQTEINEGLEGVYHDENGVEYKPSDVAVTAFEKYNDSELFTASFSEYDKDDNLIAIYLLGTDLKGREMFQKAQLYSLIYSKYNTIPEPHLNGYDEETQEPKFTYKYSRGAREHGVLLGLEQYKSFDDPKFKNENAKEHLMDVWETQYGKIALDHNDMIDTRLRKQKLKWGKKKTGNIGTFSLGYTDLTESIMVKMISESIKKHLK